MHYIVSKSIFKPDIIIGKNEARTLKSISVSGPQLPIPKIHLNPNPNFSFNQAFLNKIKPSPSPRKWQKTKAQYACRCPIESRLSRRVGNR